MLPELFVAPGPGNEFNDDVMTSQVVHFTQKRPTYSEMKAKRILFLLLSHFKTIFGDFYTFPFNNESIAVAGIDA